MPDLPLQDTCDSPLRHRQMRCLSLYCLAVCNALLGYGCMPDPDFQAYRKATDSIMCSLVDLVIQFPELEQEWHHTGVVVRILPDGACLVVTSTPFLLLEQLKARAQPDEDKALEIKLMPAGWASPAEQVFTNEAMDFLVCVVRPGPPKLQAAKLGNALPNRGESIWAIKINADASTDGESGVVTDLVASDDGIPARVRTDLHMASGVFGGAMVNASGELIAVAASNEPGAMNSFGIAIQDILSAFDHGQLEPVSLAPVVTPPG